MVNIYTKHPPNLSMTIPATREVHYALINIDDRVVATFMKNEHGLILNWVVTSYSNDLYVHHRDDTPRMYIE